MVQQVAVSRDACTAGKTVAAADGARKHTLNVCNHLNSYEVQHWNSGMAAHLHML